MTPPTPQALEKAIQIRVACQAAEHIQMGTCQECIARALTAQQDADAKIAEDFHPTRQNWGTPQRAIATAIRSARG